MVREEVSSPLLRINPGWLPHHIVPLMTCRMKGDAIHDVVMAVEQQQPDPIQCETPLLE